MLSSLGEEEIIFTNYTVEQLHNILKERIEEAFIPGVVTESAINLCAAMAGREHGDARRAIDLLRVAGEITEREQKDVVGEEQVRAASQKIEESKEVTALRTYPLHEKLIILAVMRTPDPLTGKIYSTYKDLCKATRQNPLTQRRTTQILSEIEMSGIVSSRIIHQGTYGRTKKHQLNIQSEVVYQTFQNDTVLDDII